MPFFLTHAGCGSRCSFCNQEALTGVPTGLASSLLDFSKRLSSYARNPHEIALYGGDLLNLPAMDIREVLHKVSGEVREKLGALPPLRVSTSPRSINREKLQLLGEYNVKTVEIGAVSTSEVVLRAARRGYSRDRVIFAVNLVRDMGFEAGVQFVTGLPGDTLQSFQKTLSDVLSIGPRYAVLYPLVVLKGTELARLFRSKKFQPPGRSHILKAATLFIISCKMWKVKIARIGLYDSDMDPNDILCDSFPGNLRQEAEGVLCRLMVEYLISGNDTITSVNFNRRRETSVRGKRGRNLEKIFSTNPHLRGQVFFHDHASLLVGVDRLGTQYTVSGEESEFLAFATGKIMERHTI